LKKRGNDLKIVNESKVTLVDCMGTDLSIVNAARVSFDKESFWEEKEDGSWSLSEKDKKLIRYLAEHNHWTPFGHATVSFRISTPIFVARQLGKHQVGLVWNEVSRRYVDYPPEFYFPKTWRLRAENVKQGSGGELEDDSWAHSIFDQSVTHAYQVYLGLQKEGVAPEQARMVLPQNTMTEFIWTGSLAAFARVCKLRLDPHAQEETREVVEKISKEMSQLFPVSWECLLR